MNKRAGLQSPRGFTLIETTVVVVILAVLLLLVIPNFGALQRKADGVVCASRLRGLWTAFSCTLIDGKGWPQLPSGTTVGSIQEQQFWLDYSSNAMGLTPKAWQCPSLGRVRASATNSQQVLLIAYLPTLFDAKPMTPRNWPRMPWFTEIQGTHGGGNMSVRSDGTVCPIQEP